MWFEILPTFGIITVCMSIPQFFPAVLHYGVFGNIFRRSISGDENQLQYLRDSRLGGGDPYKIKGIEAIPDE